MSDILFGQSYYLRFDPKLWAAMQPYAPLGTLYAASYARSKGYDVALFDAMLAPSEAAWAAALEKERPRFAILYEDNFNYLSKMCLLRMRRAADAMIGMARERNCVVIVAGSDATDHADHYLRAGATYVLLGEGEATLVELLDRLGGRTDRPLTSIRGLAFVDSDASAIVETPRRPDLSDLDALPFPAWDLVDVGRYQEVWHRRHGYFSMNVVTTRGCPYHCNWCAKPIWGQRYNCRSPHNVVDELAWLKAAYQPDHLWFADDIMGLKPGWLSQFADLVEARQVRIPFKSLHRVDLLLRGVTIDALRRAGAKTVWVGAESGAQKVLDAMEKGTHVEQIREATRRLHRAGIDVGFFLQFGYPGETREDVEETLRLVRDCQPDDIGMSVSYPLPGTRFYAAVQQQLGERRNWQDSADLAMLYQGPYGSAFYRQLHTVLHKEFRARRAWRDLRGAIQQPVRLRGGHLRRAAAMAYHAGTLPLARRKLDRLTTPATDRAANLQDTRRAFDAVADTYDGPSGNNALAQRMRQTLLDAVTANVPPGARLLDLGCGTGIDAVYLAQRGYDVVAIDAAPSMVARTRERAARAGLDGMVRSRVLDMHDLAWLAGEHFDGIYSDLGPLNCALDLPDVLHACAELLTPGGTLVASVIGRWCPWELLYYGARGRPRRALLRTSRDIVPVPLAGGTVWTRYFTPREFVRALGPDFTVDGYRSLNLLLPPPYLVGITERFPALTDWLAALDARLGALPLLRALGDHFLLVATKHG